MHNGSIRNLGRLGRKAFLWALLIWPSWMYAQEGGGERGSWEEFVELMSELTGSDEEEEATDEQQMNDLYEVYLNPINLNALDERRLKALPFLDPVQVLGIIDYTQRHHPVLSTGELMAITSLDWRTRRLLQLFCIAGEPQKKDEGEKKSLKVDNELTVRTDIPLYTKMGYATYSAEQLAESPNKVYQGSQPYMSLRYTLDVGKHVEAGLMMEKDGGEEGVDYWAAYAVIHDWGKVETLALGHFRASFGLGLVINNNTSLGKIMMLSSISRLDRGFRRHSSMSETGYMQGGGITLQLGRQWHLSAYGSSRDTDGTLNSDSTGISSLKTDGLHRTLLEKSKKGIVTKVDAGGNLRFQSGPLRLSGTVAYTHFSIPLQPKYDTASSLYRLYNAQGSDFLTGSLSYAYYGSKFRFAGETAMSKGGALATLNMLQADLSGHKLTLIARSYSKRFVSINGNTFSENSSPQNESGIYLGWQHNFSREFCAEAYVDGIYFPWMRYQASGSSYGIDAMAQLSYSGGKHDLSVRYKIKSKQRDITYTTSSSDTITQLMFNTVQSLRAIHTWRASAAFTFKTSLIGASAYRPDTGNKWGWAVGEQVTWKTTLRQGRYRNTLRLIGGLTYFHTDSYSSRVYAYEPGMRYSYGMKAFYYHGMRAVLCASVPIVARLDITAKIASTKYFDRETIGTGLDEILQDHREDLQLQMRWRF